MLYLGVESVFSLNRIFNEALSITTSTFITPICFRSLNSVFSESAALPWAGFEMLIFCITMILPFQTGEKPKI